MEYKSWCRDIGQQSVDSLIEFNIVHLRQCAKLPYDYQMTGESSSPIITPHLPSDIALIHTQRHMHIQAHMHIHMHTLRIQGSDRTRNGTERNGINRGPRKFLKLSNFLFHVHETNNLP